MRPRLAVALTFPVLPALGGGQVRVLSLYRELARTFDVEIVSLVSERDVRRRLEIAPGLVEHRVPKSKAHAKAERELEHDADVVVTDVAMPRLHSLTPDYLAVLREASDGAAAVVASHPYTHAAIRAVSDAPLCYEAHNVEASLKSAVLSTTEAGRDLLADVERSERICCEEAALVWTCSEADRDDLADRYRLSLDRVVVVPNGVAADDFVYTDQPTRLALQERLRIADRLTALFLASWHPPNILAGRRVVEVAAEEPSVDFLVVGSVGSALAEDPLPDNVQLMGTISAEHKSALLSVADVALNPVTTGSGTNIKMLDYFASGIPVISSLFGARGLGVVAGEHYVQAEPDKLGSALHELRVWEPTRLASLVEEARRRVVSTLSWPVLAAELTTALCDHLGTAVRAPTPAA